MDLTDRFEAAKKITTAASLTALEHFQSHDALAIETKGAQDWVSNADKSVELQIRKAINEQFPNDGIIGEEYDNIRGESGYDWVIDPIDGTTSFINAIPGWCVVVACVFNDKTVFGVIVDPIANETFSACAGVGATLNDKPMQVSTATQLTQGTVAVGHSSRVDYRQTLKCLEGLMSVGGMPYKIGSGALMLVYVAAGRLLGYLEPHMNAWDCIAALFIIEQAGGEVREFDMQSMLSKGGPVVTACPGVFAEINELANVSYNLA